MTNYANVLNKQTPTSQPIPGKNMVKNNAGGFSFEITAQQQLERFLLLGTSGGTYYANAETLTLENASNVINLIKHDGSSVLNTVTDYIKNNRAPKIDASIFVLALLCTYGDAEVKQGAYAFVQNLKTATHLFMFVANVNSLRGWSRGLRTAVSKWYLTKNADKLAYQVVKYRNREGFTHRDVLRLAHPKTTDGSINSILGYAVGKVAAKEANSNLILGFEAASIATIKELVSLIKEYGLTWEMIPTDKLNEPKVLEALLDNMPVVAMIRNLNRFAKAGLTEGNSPVTKAIVAKLNKEAIQKSGIHPVNLVTSMVTYTNGRGFRGTDTWAVNQTIADALNEAYYHALEALVPTGKDILIGLDVSGSMNTPVDKNPLTASQLGAVLSLTMLKNEPNAELLGFDTSIRSLNIGKRTAIEQAVKAVVNGGGTDCSIPIRAVLERKQKVDAIIILTDNETWAGTHGVQALEQYRRLVNKDVKVIEIAMTANKYSNVEATDPNVLRVVGFDSSVTALVNNFIKG